MKKSMFCLLTFALAGSVLLIGSLRADDAAKKPKNLILMIGDGMGINCDAAGTYFRFGKAQAQRYHQFRFLTSATFCLTQADFDESKDVGYIPETFWKGLEGGGDHTPTTHVTDSAASGTALNSGQKTKYLRIGCDFDGKPLKLLSQYAEEAGMSVGAVSSVQIANATPAAVMAHQYTRSLLKEISREQILDQKGLTVLMGAGNPEYSDGAKIDKPAEELSYDNVGGRVIWEELKKDNGFAGVKFIDDKAEFEEIAAETPDKKPTLPKRLLGVAKSVETLYPVDGAPDAETQEVYLAAVGDKAEAVQANIPSLSVMAVGALNVLAQNEKGFYLMVEGGAIDHANHGNNIRRSVLEHTAFSKAIDAVIDWVEKYSSWDDTLLIITVDHETGQLWGKGTYDDKNGNNRPDEGEAFNGFKHVKNNGKGILPSVQYATGGHSNGLVPVWINGAGADNVDRFIRGVDKQAAEFYGEDGYKYGGEYIYNSDIPKIFKAAAGFEDKKK